MGRQVYFDGEVAVTRVGFAVAPFDAFTGVPVADGLLVELAGRPERATRNLSQQFVFLALGAGRYRVLVRDAKRRYFDADPLDVSLPSPAGTQSLSVPLMRLPGTVFPAEATLVAGVAQAHGAPVEGAIVRGWVEPQAESVGGRSPVSTTKTDRRGAFTLPLHPPQDGQQGEMQAGLWFSAEGLDDKALSLRVALGRLTGLETIVEMAE